MEKTVEFTIKCKMNERWINDFCSMLKYMESCGNIGHSAVVGFYSDGDGDFRPKFEFDKECKPQHGYWEHELKKDCVLRKAFLASIYSALNDMKEDTPIDEIPENILDRLTGDEKQIMCGGVTGTH